MGFPPEVIDRMSLWEYAAAIAGHRRFHGVEDEVAPPTYEEHFAMIQAARQDGLQ